LATQRVTVVLATIASSNLMGQQVYEHAILEHLQDNAASVRVRPVRVKSFRSDLPGEVRIPTMLMRRLPLWAQVAVGAWAYGRPALVHRCDLRLPPAIGPEVLTVHDTSWLRFPDEGTPPAHYMRAARRAALVIVPSAFASSEVAAGLGIAADRLRVVHNGVDPRFAEAQPLRPAELTSLGLPLRFVLHSGGCSRRKNLPLLAAAWKRIADVDRDVHLVLCGPLDRRRDSVFAGLPRVHIAGNVHRDLHVRLTATAVCVVIPSLYEGFGLPAVEAMAAGSPVVAAAGSCLEEVCGDAALVVPPDAANFADAVLAVITYDALYDAYRRRGRERSLAFSWAESARLHEEIYLQAVLRAGSGERSWT
jgi:glycosyltransferase involved in cell wall biosynthesis